ncbi:hypothetical protein RIF29_11978 [Crotalaria pallida]|uniref:Uncharacterized protein n=1 Tax=Crotalaria pallida TaxID=3830 RepID=A0AAN9IMP5_CROPI
MEIALASVPRLKSNPHGPILLTSIVFTSSPVCQASSSLCFFPLTVASFIQLSLPSSVPSPSLSVLPSPGSSV